jgi:hypothetical protein
MVRRQVTRSTAIDRNSKAVVTIMKRIIGSASIATVILATVFGAPLLSRAALVETSVSITNNGGREIRHIYLSPTSQDNWGPDLLEPTVISPGGSYTLSNIACSGSDIKVIAEDQDGCFLYRVVTCGQSSTWTITSDTPRDCGN